MALPETTTRVLVALAGIPVALGVVYAGGWALGALLALIAVLATLEFYRMARRKGAQPLALLGCVLAFGFVLLAAAAPQGGPDGVGYGAYLALCLLATATVAIWVLGVEGQPLLSIATTVMGAAYTGGLLGYGLFLRHLPGVESRLHGAALLFAPLLLTWASDTFAYFAGRAWGTRKLIPRVSPGKTVQGAVGALLGTVAVAAGYGVLLGRFATYRIGPGEALLLGLLVSVAAQVGDLAESLLKRDAGVKDSGTLLPGHGGALDRFDSLLFTLPLAYFFFRYLVGPG